MTMTGGTHRRHSIVAFRRRVFKSVCAIRSLSSEGRIFQYPRLIPWRCPRPLVPIVALLAVTWFWYGMSPSYVFPPATRFGGASLYNPYEGTPSLWLKANLHAHAHAWGGVTNGRSTVAQTVATYRAEGYDVAAVSNYQSIDARPGEVRVYEQGYSAHKAHLLVIGAKRVDWWDYPLLEGPNEKQDRIDRLRKHGALVAIVHPEMRNAFSASDMRRLTGYSAFEVVSHFGDAEPQWDAALSAGRLSWAIGDDDTHDSANPRQTGHVWTMLAAPSTSPTDVIDAIKSGHTYAVISRVGRGYSDVMLRSLETRGDTIDVAVAGHPASITFVGQGGRLLQSTGHVLTARYVLPPDQPYARVVVRTAAARLILNPIVRTRGGRPPMQNASAVMSPGSLAGAAALMIFAF